MRDIIEILKKVDRSKDQKWLENLASRKREESTYHDYSHSFEEISSRETGRANKKYYLAARSSIAYREAWIRREAKGSIFLDYACGSGEQVIAAAKAGARLAVGVDISPGSIHVARQRARLQELDDTTLFVCADCEGTEFPSSLFDAVLCSGVLHHMDLSYAFPELRRILRPGGKILAVEALGANPLISLYRRLTPKLRTDWETDHIIGRKDIEFAARFFDVRDIKYWHLFSIATVPFRKYFFFAPLLRFSDRLDAFFLSIPFVQKLAWQISFELHNTRTG